MHILILASLSSLLLQPSAQPPARALRLDDLFAEQHVSVAKDWSIARDGALAIQIERAANTRKSWQVFGADVWVQLKPGGSLTNITNGAADGTDWRDPIWSPDGSKIVMASTRGGTRSLWLWDRATGRVKSLGDRSLGNGGGYGDGNLFYEWADDEHLIAAVLPAGYRAAVPGTRDPDPVAGAKAAWKKYLDGEVSASVLETGRTDSKAESGGIVSSAVAPEQMRQIIRIDVTTGNSAVITDIYRPALLNILKPEMSPSGKYVTVPIYAPPLTPNATDIVGGVDIAIYRVDGQPVKLDRPLPTDALRGLGRWSPDGSELAYFAFVGSRERAPSLVRVNMTTGRVTLRQLGAVTVTQMRDNDWDFARAEWTENGDVVTLAGAGAAAREKFARRDWWLVPTEGEPRNLTEKLTTVPDFQRVSATGPLVGVADGVLWKIDVATGTVQPLTDRSAFRANAIAWPETNQGRFRWAIGRNYIVPREERPAHPVLVLDGVSAASTRRSYLRVDVSTGQRTELARPSADLVLARLDPVGEVPYWTDDAPTMSSIVWRGASAASRAESVVRLNGWRSAIASPPDTVIQYTSQHGEPYRGWIQLPVNYQPGRRYPMIVHIYPGQRFSSQSSDSYNRVAAAAGYAVLWPQMGTPNGHHFNAVTKDVFFDVPNGVLPAIDKAIELGIADPARLFVEGLSGGGFATMAIIEQTNRFKAAIAGVGISSWMNGSFSSRGRYGEDVVWMNIGWMNDNIQDRPPQETMWSDFGLFMRNSPIIYADRIQTPLLLQSADQDDNVPMSQSEEMFSAMVQLKKRATFVRYWGEGHGLASPANIRDFWQRRLAWFDEWGDIGRDARGHMVFDGGQVKGRGGSPALKPADYSGFDLFRKGGGGN